MKQFILTFFAVLLSMSVFAKDDIERLLTELDNTIENRSIFVESKEKLIANIKGLLKQSNVDDHQLYGIYSSLYNEYVKYNLDSAMLCANYKYTVAKRLADPDLINQSKLDLANIYIISGMYFETLELMNGIDRKTLIPNLIPRYYHIYRTVYGAMLSVCTSPEKRTAYSGLVNSYRDSLRSVLGATDISYVFVLTDEMNEKGEYQKALNLLIKKYQEKNTTVHEKAMLAYSLSTAYLGVGNREEAKRYMILSAINDIQTPVREYKSLQELAFLLYQEGKIERAYNYINCSINDALESNARMNMPAITRLMPIIAQAYDRKMKERDHQQSIMLLFISILVLALGVAMIFMNRQKKHLLVARAVQNNTNQELSNLNDALVSTNAKLLEINQKLLESNSIKDAYVGRYMDLCSAYIDSVEKYRSNLNKIARTEGSAEVMKAIRSSTYVEDELREFYTNFDATFLHLFPNFVEQFNALLMESERLTPKQGRLLNTELRIFALIRLGITDSVKIAGFLRHSVSTIYNYRVKMRNAALNDRDDFENQVMKLGPI